MTLPFASSATTTPDTNQLRTSKSGGQKSENVTSFSKLWAKRYVDKLATATKSQHDESLITRDNTALYLQQALRTISAQAWGKTEALLAAEVVRHEIDFELINPWDVAKDAYEIYDKLFAAYVEQIPPQRFSVRISRSLGQIREKYTSIDPRIIGFISMQFHYTGQMLLDILSDEHQRAFKDYFKVIDDHLYMPLQRAYAAAAKHTPDSTALKIVQTLLPESSAIAQRIVAQTIEQFPQHCCHSGLLSNPVVQVSSVRDVEMFQVYLWVCILENNIQAVQQELFPLCVMLYPTLNVKWDLVRYLLQQVEQNVSPLLDADQLQLYHTYHQALKDMFSSDILPN